MTNHRAVMTLLVRRRFYLEIVVDHTARADFMSEPWSAKLWSDHC